jgi:hypothetical protein
MLRPYTRFHVETSLHLFLYQTFSRFIINTNIIVYVFRSKLLRVFFYVYGSVHRESMTIIVQQDATMYSLLYFCKLFYMFRVVTPPIIRSPYNCNYIIWHWPDFGKCSVWNQLKMGSMYIWYIPPPDAVITVICASDDGWSYYPKYVEQFTEIH